MIRLYSACAGGVSAETGFEGRSNNESQLRSLHMRFPDLVVDHRLRRTQAIGLPLLGAYRHVRDLRAFKWAGSHPDSRNMGTDSVYHRKKRRRNPRILPCFWPCPFSNFTTDTEIGRRIHALIPLSREYLFPINRALTSGSLCITNYPSLSRLS